MQNFFDFMMERENIRLRKEGGIPRPWTDDPILSKYKFTNVQRHNDWTSNQLRKHIYKKNRYKSQESILMMCAFARYFGRFEFVNHIGWIDYDDWPLEFKNIKAEADAWQAAKIPVYTGAYIIPNSGIKKPKTEVVLFYLENLHKKIPEIIEVVNTTWRWEEVVKIMKTLIGFGGAGFMAKETLLDTMFMDFWINHDNIQGVDFTRPVDYQSWTPIGPGGIRGAARLLGHDGATLNKFTIPQQEALELIMKLYHDQVICGWPKCWPSLSPTDIQFQMCEFDKYERVRLGQGRPRNNYTPRELC